MTLTYKTKFERVQRLRRMIDYFYSFCDCGGLIPTMDSDKAEEHHKDCQYRIRVEGPDRKKDREVR